MIDVKANFKTKYNDLNCPLCSSATDDQPHLLKNKMKSKEAALDYVEYEDLFRNTNKQKEITNLFTELLKIRNHEINTSYIAAPSNSTEMLKSDDSIHSIVHHFFGK